MLLDLIYGKIGSGKTEKCIELIERTLKKNPTHRAILTVPDQYSYITEKIIVERLGGTGVNGIEVLTFSQFFRRYINKKKNYLTPSGKQMLYYNAVAKSVSEGGLFARSAEKTGFIKEVSELICEMKRYLVTPEDLKAAMVEEGSLLFRKLKEFSKIYEKYNSFMKPEFADSDEDFIVFADFVMESEEFSNTHIWFDGFSDFLPQHYIVIKAFLKKAQSVHITLPIEENAEEDGVFEPVIKSREILKSLCKKTGARFYEQFCPDECFTIKSPEISHLVKNWDKRQNVYKNKTDNISVFLARDLYSETEQVAKKILKEVKNGTRFRDISIMCSDMEKYSHLIEAIFSDYKIPYFSDEEMPVTNHPIILTILAAFEISEENWSYESVFKYLRTGFIYEKCENGVKAIERDYIDMLENYVLRCGIRGKKEWLCEEDWTEKEGRIFDVILQEKKKPLEDIEVINSIRKTICKPFENFYKNTSGRKNVRELAFALYEFLCDINLYEGIQLEVNNLNSEGRRNEAEQAKQIWNLLMQVIDQAVVVMGEEHCKKEDFVKMIRAALSKAVMQIIPPGLDSVSVCAADRNSPGHFDIIFFVGAIAGTMPKEPQSGGILTDAERKMLSKKGVEIAKDSKEKAKQEMFKFYRCVASANKKIFFSYPLSNSEGEVKQPANIVKDLAKMFPEMEISDDILPENEREIINQKQAFLYVMSSVSDKNLEENAKNIKEHYKWDGEFSNRLKLADFAIEYRKKQPQIKRESAKLLYNNYHNYSVSKLSDYAACPFEYFVKHGLKAKEQEVYKIQKFEIGSLLHWAVCEYCKEVEKNCKSFGESAKAWHTLTLEESNKILEKIMKDISERTLSRANKNQNKIAYLLARMEKILKRSAEIVRLSLSEGEYSAVCYEEDFIVDIEWGERKIALNGKIDRVDAALYPDEGKISLRIIDYKSGKKEFDVVSISNNTDMQLVVYAIAATELYKKGSLGRAGRGLTPSVGGILYNKLRNDMVSCTAKEAENIDELLKKDMRLDGIVVSDGDDMDIARKMDKKLGEKVNKSDFMKLSLNSKGDALNMRDSSVTTKEKFDILVNYVKKATVKLDDKIFSGDIGINPVTGKNKSACSYCNYKEICLYDMKKDSSRREIENSDEAWEFMEEETKR